MHLEIQHIEVEQRDGSVLLPSHVKMSEEEETVKISFASALLQGNAKLSITFKGLLKDNLEGFYRSKYTRYVLPQIKLISVCKLKMLGSQGALV